MDIAILCIVIVFTARGLLGNQIDAVHAVRMLCCAFEPRFCSEQALILLASQITGLGIWLGMMSTQGVLFGPKFLTAVSERDVP